MKCHKFAICKCKECDYEFHQNIPNRLKEENQYGSNVQALALSLMNIGNASVNKVRKIIYGLSEEEINPSESYIIKQKKKAAMALNTFMSELTDRCLKLSIVYWDDTVIDINKRRGCLRFYGDEKIALYKAHPQRHYAAIKSYIETCYRNGINQTEALVRLCEGSPYTVKEIFASESGE